jgi:hypothetical protein
LLQNSIKLNENKKMEKFEDEFGDLSGFKILSFEEVNKGFKVIKIRYKEFQD